MLLWPTMGEHPSAPDVGARLQQQIATDKQISTSWQAQLPHNELTSGVGMNTVALPA